MLGKCLTGTISPRSGGGSQAYVSRPPRRGSSFWSFWQLGASQEAFGKQGEAEMRVQGTRAQREWCGTPALAFALTSK